ncbi:tyrosine-type recombinase/integrase [Photobacterium halotolerans]|uniref:tyrosine-type recombinase/integrase n=1 Tax=Photobacterium halotolerans TaxID=265726 RepID=UPI00040DA170|nr:tyrosine-type recombinase/integrase [Photobacterium halotolerans]
MSFSAPGEEIVEEQVDLSLVDQFLNWKRENENCSTKTVAKYRQLLERLGQFLNGEYLAATLGKLEQFAGGQLHRFGYSAASRKVAVAAIRGFYKYLYQRRHIQDNPAVHLVYPKSGRRLPRAMGLHSAEAILLQPDLSEFSGIRDSAILALLLGCGFRVSGVCNLNESNLVWYKHQDADRLAILLKEKGEKERMVPVPSEAMLLVQAYLGHPTLADIDRLLEDGDQVLFVNMRNRYIPEWENRGELRRLSSRAVDRMIKRYAIAAGVPEDQAHPHALRHLFDTELAESDASILQIQSLMGHADPKTSAIYTHIAMRKMTAVLDQGNPLGKINTPVSELLREMQKGRKV